ncbi:MAG: BspA family leucine-rich repeat surface protein, partial [bacterium]|nr:BspA family leucine-rich repeat surface protein [bacterium]
WEKEEYEVNVVVQNGVINGESVKTISYNKNASFNIIPSIDNVLSSTVECTNGQIGVFENNKVTVKNITNDTTCTAAVSDKMTTLYEDGTLIINELYSDRSSNIATHGNVKAEYDPISDGNSYVFNSEKDQPWYNSGSIYNVEIGTVIKPISTAYWFYNLRTLAGWIYAKTSKLDTSQVINMRYMFAYTTCDRKNSPESVVYNFYGWGTSNVTDMSGMFLGVGSRNDTIQSLRFWWYGSGGIDDNMTNVWDTSNVTNMSNMFSQVGLGSSNIRTFDFEVDLWDTSNVTNMSSMFAFAGCYSTN